MELSPSQIGIQYINNDIYHELGERWYKAQDDPVALLRAESKLLLRYVTKNLPPPPAKILDVGCGGGFLSNPLAERGYKVTGIDIAPDALRVAQAHDRTRSVDYRVMDAYNLELPEKSFDAVLAMDFLEHVDPGPTLDQISKYLKPQGKLFFHTFSRNRLSWLICIKGVEWFIKNTPKNMHVLELFISPKELSKILKQNEFRPLEFQGVRPCFDRALLSTIKTGFVHKDFRFCFSSSTLLAYCGQAERL